MEPNASLLVTLIPHGAEFEQFKLIDNPDYAGVGWYLIALVPVQEPVMLNEYMPFNNNGCVTNHSGNREALKTTFRYLVGQKRDKFIEEIDARVKDAEKKFVERAILLAKNEEEIKKINKALAEMKNSYDSANTVLKSKREESDMLRKKAEQMETHLGKIRNAVGELQFKQIIEGK